MKKTKKRICKCGYVLRSTFTICDFCGSRYENQSLIKKPNPTGECLKCKKHFEKGFSNEGFVLQRKYCYQCRPKKKVKNEIEKWIDKKPKRSPTPQEAEWVAYSFFKKKHSPSKKFQACRG